MARPADLGFDASYEFPPHRSLWGRVPEGFFLQLAADRSLNIWDYPSVAAGAMSSRQPTYKLFNGVMLSWDNTPRLGKNGQIFENFSPEVYEWWLTEICLQTIERHDESERLVFINAWNEWGEGAYLEPDVKYGHRNLEATKRAVNASQLYARLVSATRRDRDAEIGDPSMFGDYFRNQLNAIRTRLDVAKQHAEGLAEAQFRLTSIRNSLSWKITAPLRKVYDLVHHLRTE